MTSRRFGRITALVMAAMMVATLAPLGAPGRAAAATLAAPTLTSPASGDTVSANPVFAWGAVADAVKYRIEVSSSPTFAAAAVAVETANLRYAHDEELPLGELYWRVAARDSTNALGVWANGTFTKEWASAPNPLTPAADDTLQFPADPLLFTWDPLPGAQSYQLQVDDADDFIGAETLSTKNTAFVITDPLTSGQSFWWRVRGVSGGLFSDYSAPRAFSVDWPSVPVLVAPADTATVTDVVLDWAPVPGAKSYQVQVSPNGDWANNVTVDVTAKGTRYSPPTTLNNGNYFWRVRAKDAAANNGLWSTEWRFQRAWSPRPTLLTPANGDFSVDDPTFSWTPIQNAAYYEIEWSEDPNFFPTNSDSCYTNHTRFTPYSRVVGSGEPGGCSISLPVGATVYWHVRGIDSPVKNPGAGEPGVLGLWSNTSPADLWSFAYIPPTPQQVSPADGATVEVPTLTWDNVPTARRYRVTIVDKDGDLTSGDTYSTSFTPTGALDPAQGPFKWYVRAYDYASALGVIPAQADWWTFSLTAISTTYPAPEQTGPAAGAQSYDMPSLTWQPVTGAAKYKVWYSPNGSVYTLLGSQTEYPAYTYPTTVVATGTYWWYVEAFDDGNALLAASSSASNFVIKAPDLMLPAGYSTPTKCPPASPCSPIADTPTLRWDSIPGALVYRVYIANDPNFTNIYRTYDTVFTELTPRESFLDNQANQAFYWFVRPLRTDNTGRFDSEAQANASAFQKRSQGIALATPASSASVGDELTFTWADFLQTNQGLLPPVTQEAELYRIQTSLVADFASIYETATVDQTTFTSFAKTYPEGPVYWRVQALDASGNSLTFSSARLVTKTSLPVIQTYPANAAVVPGVPYLQWQPRSYAATYDVYVDTDANFSSPISGSTSMTAWAYINPLAGGTYYWKVRAKDADGRAGPWSTTRSFRLDPAAPTLTSPTNGAKPNVSNLLFQWTTTYPLPKYRLDLSTSAAFSGSVSGFPVTTVMTAWAPKAVLANGTYYWRVNGLNASGQVVATSATFSFTVDSTRPTVVVTPASGMAITSAFTATFSEPVTGVDGTDFSVVIAGTSTKVPGSVTVVSPTVATFTPTSALMPGQTYTVILASPIQDLNGNLVQPTGVNVRTSLTVQESSVAVSETWGKWSTGSANGGSMKLSRKGSTQLTYAFAGTSIALVGFRGPQGGYASIYLDGVLKATGNFYASSNKYKATIWSASGLAAGSHTLRVVPKGTKPKASSSTWVYVDAFRIDGPATVDDTSTAVRMQFRRFSTTSAYGSAYDVTNHKAATGKAGPAMTFQFKGTGFTWYGTKGRTYGKAAVYIDGVKKATVDLYRSSTAYKSKVWASATLSNTVHTVRIVALGSKQKASKGYDVSFDQFVLK